MVHAMWDARSLPTIVSLFSGAGGLDLGLSLEGFEIAFATDKSPAAIASHQHNFRSTAAVQLDLTQVSIGGVVSEIEAVIPVGASIGIIGGPPCQGFSKANTSALPDDPRNSLVNAYLNVIHALRDRYHVSFVLFENVLGIRYSKNRHVYDRILSSLTAAELTAQAWELNALDYGVPQIRKRVIISGFDEHYDQGCFKPVPEPLADTSVRAAIGGLPEPVYYRRGMVPADVPHHPNHWTMQPRSPRFERGQYAIGWERSFRRLDWSQPSPTVAYGNREIHIHPSGHRRLSVYEAMLLQGFPAEFELMGSLSAQVEQVSNAVPPPLARCLARATKKALRYG